MNINIVVQRSSQIVFFFSVQPNFENLKNRFLSSFFHEIHLHFKFLVSSTTIDVPPN